MNNVKNKMYDYEVTPPEGVWESIAAELDNDKKVVVMPEIYHEKKINFSLMVAATIAVLVFCLLFFKNNSTNPEKEFASNSTDQNDSSVMRVPDNDEAPVKKDSQQIAKNTLPEKKIKSLKTNNTASVKSYVTIAGPEGQPVQVSSKVATLIESSDDNNPSKTAWNKKIHKWKDMMLTNTLAPTPGNFLDIVELNNTLKDRNTN